MSKEQVQTAKETLTELLRKQPRPETIQSVQDTRTFMAVHAAASKYIRSGKSNLADLNSHLNQLNRFFQR